MREILFRGKRIDNGEWVYGGYYTDGKKHYIVVRVREIPDTRDWEVAEYFENNPTYVPTFQEVIPETVGQFTGLTDKNGKKIFEGDIVEYMGLWGGEWEVCFSANRCGWYPFACGDGCGCCESINVKEPNNGVVIGNIHDSPELLKGGE